MPAARRTGRKKEEVKPSHEERVSDLLDGIEVETSDLSDLAERDRKNRERSSKKDKNAEKTKKVSYVKKPFAVRSKIGAALLTASVILGFFGMHQAVATRGQMDMTAAAFILCSFIVAAASLWYSIIAFLEDECSYRLAKICLVLSVFIIIAWIVMIVIGIRG